jgi:hypothetical protein
MADWKEYKEETSSKFIGKMKSNHPSISGIEKELRGKE